MTRKPLREKCPNTELFLVRIYCIRTEYGEILRYSDTLFVFRPNTGKYGPEITPYLDIFYAMILLLTDEHAAIIKQIFTSLLDINFAGFFVIVLRS